uniref:UvrD-like helicase ATP-binding domain-containing protein n=1 Tax=Mycena chlorophos TaxID=658473 RepID=A0ABQ0L649_MYCCL|nr:predicted protein [Mycena chlorophos]
MLQGYPPGYFESLGSSSCDAALLLSTFEQDILYPNPPAALTVLKSIILNERDPVVRLVLSRINRDWLINDVDFPTTPDAFADSAAQLVLGSLSTYFQYTPSTLLDLPDGEWAVRVGERRDQMRLEYRKLVSDAPLLLANLKRKLAAIWEKEDAEAAPLETGLKVKRSQKQQKQARRAAAQAKVVLDFSPLERLGIGKPETADDVNNAIREVLICQKGILKIYLKALASPELAQSLVAACWLDRPAEVPELQLVEEIVVVEEVVAVEVETRVDAHPVAQPMKLTAFFNDNANGLGAWTINLSPRGERDLREHRRRDRKVFKIILKKIGELSNGHFSPDNQKRLNHKQVDVPVYEAKMTGDLRLVYQIDCIPTYDSSSERQAIKIFGVYTHAQIGRVTFWDTMGRELAKKGKEYRDRCAFRQRPVHAGDHVFAPGTFPAPQETRTVPTGCAPDLPPDDLEQIQSLLLKSVRFSQPLLESILKQIDAAFILQISPTEQDIIEHPHSCYVLGRSGTGKTTTQLYKMVLVEANYERTKEETPEILEGSVAASKPRQLFVTQSRILAEKVEEHYRKLSMGYQVDSLPDAVTPEKQEPDDLVDVDDEIGWRSDLPERYSELKDEHFPLFLTFDALCKMIENDLGIKMPDHVPSQENGSRLTYDRFLQHYWPHFPQSLTKGIDSAMVYSEFLGVIMGSEDTLSGETTYLSRDAYINLSERAQSSFADQRERIYTLFEAYQGLKRTSGDVDPADRTHAILRRLEQYGVPGKKIDYLYVDETQDNLLIDTLLLRSICHNPNGLFWAGDTAQTISVGSSFRFNELKAFLFRIEERRRAMQKLISAQPELQPRTFQLTVNYRSHAGIVNCAHSVIEIITMFWPYAIDVLERERGTVDGLRPVFFTNFDEGNIAYEQFLFGDREGSYIEFGAQQCILVRDEAARDRLRAQVGDIGLIMTLYESKGLEFNDVLIFNFFEDSTVGEAQWRVVLNALDEDSRKEAVPAFDKARHAGVCVELKFLYVAITRARNNVWIADTSEKGAPMRTVWAKRDQVQTLTPGQDTPRLAMSSTAEEWEDQGRKLFANKRYRQSKHCFERAQRPRLAAMAAAYYSRQEARKLPAGPGRRELEARKAAFVAVAAEFMSCAQEDGNLTYFRIAAQCYEEAGNDAVGDFDSAVDVIKNHRENIKLEVLENVTSVARLFYFKESKPEKAKDLFDSFEEQLEYLEDRGLDDARASLLESLGRYSDAAQVHLEEGRTVEAIKLFLRDLTDDASVRRGIDCVLQGLRDRITFNVVPSPDDEVVNMLLNLSAQVADSPLPLRQRNELLMFHAVRQRDLEMLAFLSEYFEKAGDSPAALLCLGHCFTRLPKLQSLDVHGVSDRLKLFYRYVKLLHSFVWADPCANPRASRLFGIVPHSDKGFLIRAGTFLHSAFLADRPEAATASDIVLGPGELRDLYHVTLKERLRIQVMQEDSLCRQTRAFTPCLMYTVFGGNCNRPACPHEHLNATKINREHYNTRLRIHLLQILILHSVQYINVDGDLSKRRYWLSRLYATLHPPYYRLGSAACLDFTLIPEAESGLQVARQWVRSWAYDCEFLPHHRFLSDLSQIARLGFQFDRRDAMSFLTQGQYMRMQPARYRRSVEDDSYIVSEFLRSLEAKTPACICAGVVALRHIVANNLPIDASILCDTAEHLCACVLIAHRQARGSLHGLVVPLSWVVDWNSVVGEGERTTEPVFYLLLQTLEMLIRRIYSGDEDAEHLLFQNSNLAELPGMIRDAFLARTCRCIALLGYNASRFHTHTRTRILNMITSTHRKSRTQRKFTVSYQFMEAQRWSDIARALYNSTQGSPMDELIQLVYSGRPPLGDQRNVRKIVYDSVDAIPRLLGSSSREIIENLALVSPDPDEENPVHGQAAAGDDPEEKVVEEEEVPEFVDVGEGEADDPPAAVDAGPVEMPPALAAVERTEDEINAAIAIQRMWRFVCWRVRCRKEENARSAAVAGVAQFYALCKAETRKWPQAPSATEGKARYRLCFLGPLPHLLFALSIMRTTTQQHKTQAKKALREAKHEKLDVVDKQLTALTNALKQIIQLEKTLGPTAAGHHEQDLTALKAHVTKAMYLLKDLPFGMQMQENVVAQLEHAYKGIVKPRVFVQAVKAKPLRPELNVEDVEEV